MIVIGSMYRFIKDADLEDAVNNSQTLLSIYQETSEFEQRSSITVFERIIDRATSRIKHGAQKDLAAHIVMPSKIVEYFVVYESRLFILQLENRDQYIATGYRDYLEEPVTEDERQAFSVNQEQLIKDRLGKQFDEIVAQSGEDLLHGFYLGRDVLATKISVGKKQTPRINQKLQQT